MNERERKRERVCVGIKYMFCSNVNCVVMYVGLHSLCLRMVGTASCVLMAPTLTHVAVRNLKLSQVG